MLPIPTIKGIFVKSHIKVVIAKKGKEGLRKLELAYGKPLDIKNFDDIPVREEVKIIECALDILKPGIPLHMRAYEAGKLHFVNFSGTPLGKLIFSTLPKDFKFMMMHAKYIAQHVFKNVKFTTIGFGESSFKVIMENNDYPIEHFQGFFQAWADFFGQNIKIEARERGQGRFEYTMVI